MPPFGIQVPVLQLPTPSGPTRPTSPELDPDGPPGSQIGNQAAPRYPVQPRDLLLLFGKIDAGLLPDPVKMGQPPQKPFVILVVVFRPAYFRVGG
jgi:hypothetical protein